MLSSFATCTYSAQFFNALHSNWITKLSDSRLLRKRIASCQCNGLNTLRMIWLILLRATAKHFLSMHCKKALSNSKRNERNTSFCFIVAFQFRWTGQSSSYYGVHLRTKIIENKRQFEVQKLDYPCRNLVIWIWNRSERSQNSIIRTWSYFEQVETIKGKLDIADVEVQITIPTKMQITWFELNSPSPL